MKVAVIFGGRSSEYNVSCISAASVLKNMHSHDILKIGISEEGKWFKTSADADCIRSGAWIGLSDNCEISVSFNSRAFVWEGGSFSPDVVFPVIHGRNGEDGTLQGLFELMRVPYVGCGVLSSALCMDKAAANTVFDFCGIRRTEWLSAEKHEYLSNRDGLIERIRKKLTFPIFIKPANAGSSIGISKCSSASELPAALGTAFHYDVRVVAENAVENPTEIEVAVLGNDCPVASVSGKICPANDFYDFNAKYIDSNSELYVPSGFEREDEIRSIALKAYKACGCSGLARVDFLVSQDGEIFINEINTLPGFTGISMYPKLFQASGISYGDLIEKLLYLATDKFMKGNI